MQREGLKILIDVVTFNNSRMLHENEDKNEKLGRNL